MWNCAKICGTSWQAKASGVTIVLTTHYIEEAEAIADRVGVIADGDILLVEDKNKLMAQMGIKELYMSCRNPSKLSRLPLPAMICGLQKMAAV